MSIADRKSAFLNVLYENLDKTNRAVIMQSWEEKYAHRPQFGVSAFLDEIYSQYSISIKKGQLFRALSRAMLAVELPSNQQDDTHPLERSQHEMIDRNGLVVFQNLQHAFLDLVRPTDRSKITRAQFDGVQRLKNTDSNSIRLLTNWIQSGERGMPGKVELGLLKRLFNLGYVECCELYGPVKADQMLNTALQKAGSIPEAHIMPPVNFI